MAIAKIGQVGAGNFGSTSQTSGVLDTTGADCILVGIYHDSSIGTVTDTDSDTYTLIGTIGLCSVYEAVGITDSNNKNVTVTQSSTGALIVNQIAYSGVDQTTPSYDVKTANGNPAENIVTPTDSADAIISVGTATSNTFGTDQVLVISTNYFSAWFNVVSEELLAGTSADTQSMSGATALDMVSFALAADTGSSNALSGTISAISTITGNATDINTTKHLSGTVSAVSTVTGNATDIGITVPEVHIGKWTKGTTTLIPTTTWASPNTLFDTEIRNDSSAYTFTASTSKVKLPTTNLATGYLIIASFEFEDNSAGRHNPQGRFIQASGTGNFLSGYTTGYNRDASEDRSYVRVWCFIDTPSTGAEFDFQWKRDADAPTGGTVRSEFQVISLYYNDIGMYLSTANNSYGGITPNQVTSMTTILEGTNVTRTGEVITVAGDNKRYLVLGSWFIEGLGSARTQRWGGLRVDGTAEESIKAYAYMRNSANADGGELFTHLLETVTANITLDAFIYRGAGVASGQGGADNDGGGTITDSQHCLIVIELKDGCEVFQSTGSTNQNFALTAPIDVQATKITDININDSASFTRSSDIGMSAEVAMNGLFGANISAASQAIASGSRWTAFAEFTIDGVENPDSVGGDYLRNQQSTTDTFGWSANLLGFEELALVEDIGISVSELAGSEGGGGAVHSQVGWVGFWGINLDTMNDDGGTPAVKRYFVIS